VDRIRSEVLGKTPKGTAFGLRAPYECSKIKLDFRFFEIAMLPKKCSNDGIKNLHIMN
jgi:hypothetical protein